MRKIEKLEKDDVFRTCITLSKKDRDEAKRRKINLTNLLREALKNKLEEIKEEENSNNSTVPENVDDFKYSQ